MGVRASTLRTEKKSMIKAQNKNKNEKRLHLVCGMNGVCSVSFDM